MGDSVLLIEPPSAGAPSDAQTAKRHTDASTDGSADDWSLTVARVRFGVGVCGSFVTTMIATLALIVLAAVAIPGISPTMVISGSMEPAIKRGDVVLFQHGTIDDVGPGTVVVFTDAEGRSIVHRTVSVNADRTLTTKGDANRAPDTAVVPPSALAGSGLVLIPWIGLPRAWSAEGNLGMLSVLAALFVLALHTSRWASDSSCDPWRGRKRTSPAAAWLGHPLPTLDVSLVSDARKSTILDKARACD